MDISAVVTISVLDLSYILKDEESETISDENNVELFIIK